MKHLTRQYWKIALALVAIFVSGQGVGYVIGSFSGAPHQPTSPEGGSPASWADAALARLGDELALTPAQRESLRPVLSETGQRVHRERERALFQIHLHLLAAHHDIAPALEPDQKERLDASKKLLQHTIESRFPSFLQSEGEPNP